MSRIFLSHSSANNAEAIAIRDWMAAQGWDDVFLDLDPERGLRAGERWQEGLKRAAERCEMVVFVISPVWAASKWCLAEFLLAKSLNKRVFATIVDPTPLSELPPEMTAEWQVTDLTTGARDYRAAVTLPGGKTADVAFGTEGLDRLRIGLVQAGLDPKHFAWPPANDPDRPPYRGLLPLEGDDAGIFFGREAAIIDALDRLRGLREAPPPRLLVILAASGAGKSSLLRAGLLPRLARDDRQFLPLPIIRPERAAISGETGLLRALEGAFRTANHAVARADLRAAIEGGASALRALLSLLARKVAPATPNAIVTPKAPTLVLSIDQGEELFLAEGQGEAKTFLTLLHDIVTVDAPAVTALFTIRSDSYERLQLAEQLDGLRQQPLSLPPMPRGSYAEVIRGPAKRLDGTPRALKIDDALVDALLTDIDADGAKDALPLLAFTLERLYGEYGATGQLKLAHYEKLGRISGSIEAAVERAFGAADADPRLPKDRQARLALLRCGLIPWLAGIDPDTGAARRRVARLSEIPTEARPFVDLLVAQRLLSTDVAGGNKEITIEPAHEALLRRWRLLQGWLNEDATLLTTLDDVKHAARDWTSNGKANAWLAHAGERLHMAERLQARADLAANLDRAEKEYIIACRMDEEAARTRARRDRLAKVALVALAALVLLAGVVSWKRDVLREQVYWHGTMGPSLLTADREKMASPGSNFKECAVDCPTMVVLPAGKFTMGSPEHEKDRDTNEGPQHEVTIAKLFAVGRTKVTFAEWDACVAAGACRKASDENWGRGNQPVIHVSWEDAKQYVAWLSRITGKEYRLLTEAEWEYAARAGSETRFSFGDDDDEAQLKAHAWYLGNSGKRTQPVGELLANAFGLRDVHGNVYEWVEDYWHLNYDGAPSDGSAWTKDGDASHRVVRGSSWGNTAKILRTAHRGFDTTTVEENDRGFRVARTLNP
jgi:formylglycine-generating enzyme required for sulfatase activity